MIIIMIIIIIIALIVIIILMIIIKRLTFFKIKYHKYNYCMDLDRIITQFKCFMRNVHKYPIQ